MTSRVEDLPSCSKMSTEGTKVADMIISKYPVVMLTKLSPDIISMKVSAEDTKLLEKQQQISNLARTAAKKPEVKKSYDDDATLSDVSVYLSEDEEIEEAAGFKRNSVKSRIENKDREVKKARVSESEKNRKKNISSSKSETSTGKSASIGKERKNERASFSQKSDSQNKETKTQNNDQSQSRASFRNDRNKVSKQPTETESSSAKKAKKEDTVQKIIPYLELAIKGKTDRIYNANARYKLTLGLFTTSALESEPFRKFTNLATDCVVSFNKQPTAAGSMQGNIELFFGDFLTLQLAMQRMCQLSVFDTKSWVKGCITCMEIKQLDKAEKKDQWKADFSAKLYFNFCTDKREKLLQLISSKGRKQEDTKRKCVQVLRVPSAINEEMLSLLFPFSLGVKISNTESPGKDVKGPVEIEYENEEWMEAVLTCYRHFRASTMMTTKPFSLHIKNFNPPQENSTVSDRQKQGTVGFNRTGQNMRDRVVNRGRGFSSARNLGTRRLSQRTTIDRQGLVQNRNDLRKRVYPGPNFGQRGMDSRDLSAKRSRIESAPQARGLSRPDRIMNDVQAQQIAHAEAHKEALRQMAHVRGLDASNPDVIQILEMTAHLEKLQGLAVQQTVEAKQLGIVGLPGQQAVNEHQLQRQQQVLALKQAQEEAEARRFQAENLWGWEKARRMEEEERIHQEMIQQEIIQQERMQQERIQQEILQQERLKQERIQQERLKQERLQQERIQQERIQQERIQQERIQQERIQQERIQQERIQQERIQKEIMQERLQKEIMHERLQKEILQERLQKERMQQEEYHAEIRRKEIIELLARQGMPFPREGHRGADTDRRILQNYLSTPLGDAPSEFAANRKILPFQHAPATSGLLGAAPAEQQQAHEQPFSVSDESGFSNREGRRFAKNVPRSKPLRPNMSHDQSRSRTEMLNVKSPQKPSLSNQTFRNNEGNRKTQGSKFTERKSRWQTNEEAELDRNDKPLDFNRPPVRLTTEQAFKQDMERTRAVLSSASQRSIKPKPIQPLMDETIPRNALPVQFGKNADKKSPREFQDERRKNVQNKSTRESYTAGIQGRNAQKFGGTQEQTFNERKQMGPYHRGGANIEELQGSYNAADRRMASLGAQRDAANRIQRGEATFSSPNLPRSGGAIIGQRGGAFNKAQALEQSGVYDFDPQLRRNLLDKARKNDAASSREQDLIRAQASNAWQGIRERQAQAQSRGQVLHSGVDHVRNASNLLQRGRQAEEYSEQFEAGEPSQFYDEDGYFGTAQARRAKEVRNMQKLTRAGKEQVGYEDYEESGYGRDGASGSYQARADLGTSAMRGRRVPQTASGNAGRSVQGKGPAGLRKNIQQNSGRGLLELPDHYKQQEDAYYDERYDERYPQAASEERGHPQMFARNSIMQHLSPPPLPPFMGQGVNFY